MTRSENRKVSRLHAGKVGRGQEFEVLDGLSFVEDSEKGAGVAGMG